MTHKCIHCGDDIIVGENITQGRIDNSCYVCRSCVRDYHRGWMQEHHDQQCAYQREYQQEWRHRTGRSKPMSEHRECSLYLGVVVAERVLSHVFKNVQRMPMNNPGYDFICGHDYMVDVKSSCRHHHKKCADNWTFTIRRNQIAQYFLMLAFNNRNDLDPEYIWLIPADETNHLMLASISETTLAKWDEYALDINKVSACCDAMRGKTQ